MANTEKELEDKLVEVGNRLASPPSNVEQLLSLLDQAESFLSKVEQLPSQSMSNALYPAMKALVAKELLNHSELDVKVFVASCISEITRITAPDAPYNDNLMKSIFQVIVDVFEKLNDLSTRSYSKRVSILETAASVQSCVVMLDLECDDLILEMFQHFLKTIRTSHTRNVFSSMVTIMTLILKESEDISSKLLSCLLVSVKKVNTDVLPIARRLGEKVIGNSAAKLKPYLVRLVQSMGDSLSDYSNVVASICQEDSDTQDLNKLDSSDECLGYANLEPELGCPEKTGTSTVKSPMLVPGNGTFPMENGDSILRTRFPKQRPERYRDRDQSHSVIAAAISEPDELNPLTAVKPDSLQDLITKKRMGHKSNSSTQLNNSQTNSDRAAPAVSSRRRGRSKEADALLSDGPSLKGAEASVCLQPEEKIEHESSVDLDSITVCIPDASRPKKSRRFGLKVTAKNAHDDETPSADVPSKKEVDRTIDSEAKKLMKRNITRSTRNITEREPSGVLQKRKTIQRKGIVVKVEAEELSLKEMISSPKSWKALNRDQYHVEEGGRTKSKRKCATGTVEVSEAKNLEKELNENLVGSKIKVWWPDDKMFYDGMVHSFDPVSKKHKILYSDGDVERLLLKNERWKLIEDGSKTDRGQAKDTPLPDNSTEMPPMKKMKTSSDFILKKERIETTLRSGGRPASQSKADGARSGVKTDLSKTREGPKTRYSQASRTSIDEASGALRRSIEKDARKSDDHTAEANGLCVEDPGDNSDDDFVQLGRRFKNFIRKISIKPKDETLKSCGRTKSNGAPINRNEDEEPKGAEPKLAGKSEEGSLRGRWKLRGTSAPRRGGESDQNATPARGDSKKQESDGSAAECEIRPSRVTRKRGEGWKEAAHGV